MQKVAILTHRSMTENLLKLLQQEGVMEIVQPKEGMLPAPDHIEVNFEKAELANAMDVLLNEASQDAVRAMRATESVADIERGALSIDIRDCIDKTRRLEEERLAVATAIQECKQNLSSLLPWQHVGDVGMDTKTTTTRFGFLSPENGMACMEALAKACPRSVLIVLPEEESGIVGGIAIVWKADQSLFEEIVTTFGWIEQSLPIHNEPIPHMIEKLHTECLTLESRATKIQKELSALAEELPNMRRMQVLLGWLDEKQRARESMILSTFTSTIYGWLPRNAVSRLEAKIQSLSPASAVLRIMPDDGEDIPVLIKNSLMITPFESVTKLYGLPLSSEMDPTTALSPFFILYFGLCLTDAGYGLVLALLTGLFIGRKRLPIKENTLVWLLFFSGIVTVIVSIPFGGWFGMAPALAPQWMTYATSDGGRLFHGQIWDLGTTHGITFFQNLSLALGLTHLAFGMFLAGMHKWVHGDRRGALWNDFTVHLTMGSALFYGFAPSELHRTASIILAVSVALLLWGKGYGNRWFLRPVMGLIGTLNLAIGLLSNGLSYLRILALGLVTGAIAFAVNQVAIEMSKLFPIWLGIPVMIVILFMGHLVSIALNVLGAFIHSGRLQFIEFFSQFFEGGGRSFAPFAKSIPR